MLYRLAIASGLMLTCLAATTTTALAESATVEIQFSGTVLERTSVSIPTNQTGESISSSSLKAITSSSGAASPTLSYPAGTLKANANAPLSFPNPSSKPGHNITNLRFNSTRSSNIIVSPPQFVSGSHPEPQGTTHSSLLKLATDTNTINSTNATIPPGETDLQLQTLIKAPQNFPSGTYNYTTTLTIVP
jgi:hypothetical protein